MQEPESTRPALTSAEWRRLPRAEKDRLRALKHAERRAKGIQPRRRKGMRPDIHNDDFWRDELADMTMRVERESPFLHVRYGDGEFCSVIGRQGRNSDKSQYEPETLGRELLAMLLAAADYEPKCNLFIGGCWEASLASELLDSHNIGAGGRIHWTSARCFNHGILSGEAVAFFRAVKQSSQHKVLVAPSLAAPFAARCGMEHVIVDERDAWNERARILDALAPRSDSMILLCCGMSAPVLAWKLWEVSDRRIVVDVGHTPVAISDPKWRGRRYLRNRDNQQTITRLYRGEFA